MKDVATTVVSVDADRPDEEVMAKAADVIRRGGLVAMPTETVYGLAADALSEEAVARIFVAKQRPATNPLIVHVASVEQARKLAGQWPLKAEKLCEAFWPGPLTLVVPRAAHIPDAVTAGLDTVALRMPAHPVARALIEVAERPIAAPSANRYTEVSPTTAKHVLAGLEGRVDLILDAGSTEVGLESTLVSVVDEPARLLRPGMISREQLSKWVSLADEEADKSLVVDEDIARSSPGLSKLHYSPSATVRVVDASAFSRLLKNDGAKSRRFIALGDDKGADGVICLPTTPAAYAKRLYAALHEADSHGVSEIIVERPPGQGAWEAIVDRLRRAQGG